MCMLHKEADGAFILTQWLLPVQSFSLICQTYQAFKYLVYDKFIDCNVSFAVICETAPSLWLLKWWVKKQRKTKEYLGSDLGGTNLKSLTDTQALILLPLMSKNKWPYGQGWQQDGLLPSQWCSSMQSTVESSSPHQDLPATLSSPLFFIPRTY